MDARSPIVGRAFKPVTRLKTVHKFRALAADRLKTRPNHMSFSSLAGILPAIVFPVATLAQLVRIVRSRSAAGVSVATWLLFGFANVGVYFYAERYAEWQAIVGMLVTAVLDFAIVGLALLGFRPKPGIVDPVQSLPPNQARP
jgi:uncharacterized protein with PQ loop repeat